MLQRPDTSDVDFRIFGLRALGRGIPPGVLSDFCQTLTDARASGGLRARRRVIADLLRDPQLLGAIPKPDCIQILGSYVESEDRLLNTLFRIQVSVNWFLANVTKGVASAELMLEFQAHQERTKSEQLRRDERRPLQERPRASSGSGQFPVTRMDSVAPPPN